MLYTDAMNDVRFQAMVNVKCECKRKQSNASLSEMQNRLASDKTTDSLACLSAI